MRHRKRKNSAATLAQIKNQIEDIKLQKLLREEAAHLPDRKHTPYEQLPPPSESEMKVIRERLIARFTRVQEDKARRKRDALLRLIGHPLVP